MVHIQKSHRKILTFTLAFIFFSCSNSSVDNKNNHPLPNEQETDLHQESTSVQSTNKSTDFFIKDSTKYSQTFLKEFKERHSSYETVQLIDDIIIVNNDRAGGITIPTTLPLNQNVVYKKSSRGKDQVLTVRRINYSTLEYAYYEELNGKKTIERSGTADLEPVFYFGAEGTFEDKEGKTYPMNEYIDHTENGCWTNIYIGDGSIEKSQVNYGCESEGEKLNSGLMTKAK
jgi:hypothetical protein